MAKPKSTFSWDALERAYVESRKIARKPGWVGAEDFVQRYKINHGAARARITRFVELGLLRKVFEGRELVLGQHGKFVARRVVYYESTKGGPK